MESRAQRALEIASDISKESDFLEKYLIKEEKALGYLDASISTAKNNLKLSKTIFKVNVPTLRQNYLTALDDLYDAAQKYLDQKELGARSIFFPDTLSDF